MSLENPSVSIDNLSKFLGQSDEPIHDSFIETMNQFKQAAFNRLMTEGSSELKSLFDMLKERMKGKFKYRLLVSEKKIVGMLYNRYTYIYIYICVCLYACVSI